MARRPPLQLPFAIAALVSGSLLLATGCDPGATSPRAKTAAAESSGISVQHLGGRVLAHPAIHNLYMDSSWDSDHPAGLRKGDIDGFTQQLVGTGYFDAAGQYGISSASFTGSDDAGGLAAVECPVPIAFGTTDFLSLGAWLTCLTAPGIPEVRPTVSGIPAPNDDTLYVVYVPKGTEIWDAGISTCDDFTAYHFFATTLVWRNVCSGWECTGCYCPLVPEGPWCCLYCGPICGPVLEQQTFAYAVVPLECAVDDPVPFDSLTAAATHEIIEAATDPIIPTGWIDWDQLGFNQDLVKKGEVADICEAGVGEAGTYSVRLPGGLLVAPYWSNAADACVPITHTFTLYEIGLPGTVAHVAQLDGGTAQLPYSAVVYDGSTHAYAFPSPVPDPDPGIRWVTSEPAATVVVTGDVSVGASYTPQYLLTVEATPPQAAALDASLTQSGWMDPGLVTVTTDPLVVLGPDARYRFERWTGGVSGTTPTLSFAIAAPTTATAAYALQYLVTVSTVGLGANVTHVYDGPVLLGEATDAVPLAAFADAGPLALAADPLVLDAGGVAHLFQGFAPAPPAALGAPFATTAAYETVEQLIADALASGGVYGPGAQGLANSYRQQFSAVQADLAAGQFARALEDLRSFVSHLEAQRGKHVTDATVATLERDAALVYHAALCQAVSAGHLDATAAAAEYAYYVDLASRAGEPALPACT